MSERSFRILSGAFNNGYKQTFENGLTVPIQFSNYNYCDRGETTAEVAVIDVKHDFLRISRNDNVVGWVSSEKVAELLFLVSKSIPIEDRDDFWGLSLEIQALLSGLSLEELEDEIVSLGECWDREGNFQHYRNDDSEKAKAEVEAMQGAMQRMVQRLRPD